MKQAISEGSASMCRVFEQARVCHLLQVSPIRTFVIDETHSVIMLTTSQAEEESDEKV